MQEDLIRVVLICIFIMSMLVWNIGYIFIIRRKVGASKWGSYRVFYYLKIYKELYSGDRYAITLYNICLGALYTGLISAGILILYKIIMGNF